MYPRLDEPGKLRQSELGEVPALSPTSYVSSGWNTGSQKLCFLKLSREHPLCRWELVAGVTVTELGLP